MSLATGIRAVKARSSRPRWVAHVIYLTSWAAILAACAVTWLMVAKLFF